MSARDERTSVTIVTGFLGSGKTTLLNFALRSPRLANAAVVINEFGSVPLDHVLSEASSDQIVVLENGCLCCTVFGDLVTTLDHLYHARESRALPGFDRVIIETSGLADPRPIVQAFLSDPRLAGLYRLDAIVAVLDAVNGPATLDHHKEAASQLALADRVLITKLDLLGEEKALEIDRDLRVRVGHLSPGAKIHRSDDPMLDRVQLLVEGGYSLRRDAENALQWLGADSHSPSHDPASEIQSFCLVRTDAASLYALELLLGAIERNLGASLLRVKGLIHVAERPAQPAVIQGAQHLLHNMTWLERWPDDDRSTRIVFITKGIERAELVEMVELLNRVAQRTAQARERALTGSP